MDGTMRQGPRLGAALGVVACLLVAVPAPGRAATTASPAPPAGGPAFENLPREALHEVERGQNLHLIAGYYYGDARQWERIWQANRDALRNPNRLPPGAVLRVPVDRDWKQDLSYADWLRIGGPARAVAPAQALPPAVLPSPAAEPAPTAVPPTRGAPPAAPAPPPAKKSGGAAAVKGAGPPPGEAKGTPVR